MKILNQKNPAIVFGGGINGLGLIRNLGRNGVDVYCVLDNADEAVYSKYCKKYFVIHNIQEKKEMRSFLGRLRKSITSFAVVFATSDLFSLHLSSLKDDFENDYYFILPNAEITDTLVNKKKFYRSLFRGKIPHPITFYPNCRDDIEEISKDMKYPVIVKPSFSHVFYGAFLQKGFLANSAEELIRYYLLASKLGIDVIVQEFISGQVSNLYGVEGYLDRKSLPKAFFAYRRLRGWPPLLGINSLMESVSVSEVAPAKEIAENYLYSLGYHGLYEAEFIRDPRDGVFKLLEINPRSWLQNAFPAKCGVNIIFISYLDALGEDVEYVKDYKVGLRWMHFLYDLQSSIEQKGITGAKECVTSLPGIDDWASFAWDDLMPWIMGGFYSLIELSKIFRILIQTRKRQNFEGCKH